MINLLKIFMPQEDENKVDETSEETVDTVDTDESETNTCEECNGTGLQDSATLCPACEGNGKVAVD